MRTKRNKNVKSSTANERKSGGSCCCLFVPQSRHRNGGNIRFGARIDVAPEAGHPIVANLAARASR